VIERFIATCGASREIAVTHELEQLAANQRDGENVSVRNIGVPMINDDVRPLGHADLLREARGGAFRGLATSDARRPHFPAR
jgi:hypothetical protein